MDGSVLVVAVSAGVVAVSAEVAVVSDELVAVSDDVVAVFDEVAVGVAAGVVLRRDVEASPTERAAVVLVDAARRVAAVES